MEIRILAAAAAWTACAIAAALVAQRKGYQPLAWFCYGVVLGPVAVGAALLIGRFR